MNYTLIFLIESLVIIILGCLLHFTYEWSHENEFVGIFSAVNESTWEHIKLALSAIFACTLVDVWFLGSNENYWFARSISFLVPMLVIPVLFYGYRSFAKTSILPLDIAIFVVASLLSEATFVVILAARPIGAMGVGVSMMLAVVVLVAYLSLTRFPLHNFLFEDPLTHRFGLDAHTKRRERKKRPSR